VLGNYQAIRQEHGVRFVRRAENHNEIVSLRIVIGDVKISLGGQVLLQGHRGSERRVRGQNDIVIHEDGCDARSDLNKRLRLDSEGERVDQSHFHAVNSRDAAECW